MGSHEGIRRYLSSNPSTPITGGDPLTLDDAAIEWLLSEISNIEHVERIRIGTRIIVTMPQRITANV